MPDNPQHEPTPEPWNRNRRMRVLLLASYCGDDDPRCTDSVPCRDCLGMCNIIDMQGDILANHGDIDFARINGAPPPLATEEANAE